MTTPLFAMQPLQERIETESDCIQKSNLNAVRYCSIDLRIYAATPQNLVA